MKLYFFDLRSLTFPNLPFQKPIEIWALPDEVHYQVRSDYKGFGLKLHLLDAAGNEIGFIRQKLIAITAAFELTLHGSPQPYRFTVAKRNQYKLRETGLHTTGSISDQFYDILDGERTAAKVQKVFLSKGACCETEIADGVDPALIMAFVIMIEAAMSILNDD